MDSIDFVGFVVALVTLLLSFVLCWIDDLIHKKEDKNEIDNKTNKK